MTNTHEKGGCGNHKVRLGYPCPKCGHDGGEATKEVIIEPHEQNTGTNQA